VQRQEPGAAAAATGTTITGDLPTGPADTTGTGHTPQRHQARITADPTRATGTGRRDRQTSGTTITARTAEQPAHSTGTTRTTGYPGTAGTARTEPARRTTITAGETITAIAQQTRSTAITRPGRARPRIPDIAETIAQQNPGVRIICGAITHQEPHHTTRTHRR
jgi:hypothetical protein